MEEWEFGDGEDWLDPAYRASILPSYGVDPWGDEAKLLWADIRGEHSAPPPPDQFIRNLLRTGRALARYGSSVKLPWVWYWTPDQEWAIRSYRGE